VRGVLPVRLLLIGAVTALGSLAIHMFVPAMPAAAVSLGARRQAVQMALTLYLAGVAGGQLVAGPLADRLGRRPLLIAGTALFVAGSLLCAAARSIEFLLIGRVLQALGASAGLVAGRAMAGEGAGTKGARDMALLTAIVMLSPMLAPLIGGMIVEALGWRAIFLLLAGLGAICCLAIRLWMAEPPRSVATPASSIGADWVRLARNAGFRRNLAIGTALSGGLYVFLAASPFLLVDSYGVDPHRLGPVYGAVALGAACGALAGGALATRWPIGRIVGLGVAVSVGAAAILLAGALGGQHRVAWLVVPMVVFAGGGGMVVPNAMTTALRSAQGRGGTAVSIYGAVQMAGSASCTAIVALLSPHDPAGPLAAIAALATIAAGSHFGRGRGPAS
jgi:DHA1 family bicyclomycin/chloramphenicol resistance-like MFS transporter